MKEKIINFARNTQYEIKYRIKWFKRYLKLRWLIPYVNLTWFVGTAVIISILLVSFVGVLISSNMLFFAENTIPQINEAYESEYLSKDSVIGAQITLTLVCVSLLAIVATIDRDYIYGEKLIHLAFSKTGPFSLFSLILLLFLLLVTSIWLMAENACYVYLIITFVVTIYVSIIVLYKFTYIFLNQKAIKRKLLKKYYRCNMVHMKKERPTEHHTSIPLDNLKNVTLQHLFSDNVPSLNENMRLYFQLLEITLFNEPKKIQEYLTEMCCGDVIREILDISSVMLQTGKPMYGIKTYNALLKYLNYYKIVGTVEILLVSLARDFIEIISDIKNKTEIKEYVNQALTMSAHIVGQTYLQTKVDLSYCRLAQHKLIIPHSDSSLYEMIYDEINKSQPISKEEKDELTEGIRSSIINMQIGSEYSSNIDAFRKRIRWLKEEKVYLLDTKAEPIARLFLRMIEKNDIKNLSMYDYMNSTSKSHFAKILTTLSVLDMLCRGNKRKYVADININEATTKQIYNSCNLIDIRAAKDEILEYYQFILARYVKESARNVTTVSGSSYHFCPKFNFDKNVVDTFFSYILWLNNPESDIKDIATENKFEYVPAIHEVIDSLKCEILAR